MYASHFDDFLKCKKESQTAEEFATRVEQIEKDSLKEVVEIAKEIGGILSPNEKELKALEDEAFLKNLNHTSGHHETMRSHFYD